MFFLYTRNSGGGWRIVTFACFVPQVYQNQQHSLKAIAAKRENSNFVFTSVLSST